MRRLKQIILGLSLLCLLVILLIPIPSMQLDYSKVLFANDGQLLSARIANDHQWRFPIDEDIPDALKTSIIYFEDEYFRYHPGVNPVSMAKAFYLNAKSGKIKRGGSTINMQLMRMYRGNKSRTYGQKIIELLGALKLGLFYSKDELLKMWASIAPFGGNTVGASAASWRYFERNLSELSTAEYAMLAVLPNTPSRIHLNKNRLALKEKRDRLLNKLYHHQEIDSIDWILSLDEEIPVTLRSVPQTANHFLDFMINKHPDQQNFNSTISTSLQNTCQEILQDQSNIYQHDGIENMAAVIIDIEQNKLLAYVGNTKLKGKEMRYVDCIQAPRSYGSLLKPVLFADAINRGYFMPKELVKDIPTNIAGFTPQNFDHKFRGAIPLEQMVSKSLNIPAVRVLNYVGLKSFHDLLKENLNLQHIHPNPDHHGLSIILGGAEASLWELAGIYKGLARNYQGLSLPFGELNYLQAQQHDTKNEFAFHSAAAYHTIQTMMSVNRPEEEQHFEKIGGADIAWKTGTSYGHRDAWSIGFNSKYLVAVWVGNENGDGSFKLTGGVKAAPVLFKIMRRLDDDGSLKNQSVSAPLLASCKESGMLKGKYCDQIEYIHAPKSSHQLRNCDHHAIYDLDTGQRDTSFVLEAVEEYYYHQFFGQHHTLKHQASNKASSLSVVYPENDAIIFIPKKLNQEYSTVKLEANSIHKSSPLFWFVNNEFIQKTVAPHTITTDLNAGSYALLVNDAFGNQKEIKFEVQRR